MAMSLRALSQNKEKYLLTSWKVKKKKKKKNPKKQTKKQKNQLFLKGMLTI